MVHDFFIGSCARPKAENTNLISLGHDNKHFCETYPMANKSVRALLKAIRVAHNKRRVSKRGTPEERDNSEEREDSRSESDA